MPAVPSFFGNEGRTTPLDPPLTVPGMTSVLLDARGRLLRLEVVPAQVERPASNVPGAIDWQKVLAETGVDVAAAVPTQPAWLPPTWADARVAWNAEYPDARGLPVRIEAAAYRSRPVYVRVVRPWTPPDRAEVAPSSAAIATRNIISMTLLLVALAGSAVVARRNLLAGRGDRRGAIRVGVATGGLYLARAALESNHFASIDEAPIVAGIIGGALFAAAWIGVLYLAIEPYLRRYWPHTLITWNRLLIGRLRDPLLGDE